MSRFTPFSRTRKVLIKMTNCTEQNDIQLFLSLFFFTITKVFSVIFYKFLFKNTFKRKCIMTNRLTLNFGILRLECCKLFLGNVEVFLFMYQGSRVWEGGRGSSRVLFFRKKRHLAYLSNPLLVLTKKFESE